MAIATSVASPYMNWDAPDLIIAFARFKQKCQLMFSSVLKDADDQEKVSYILLWSGEKGLDIYNSWTFTKEEDRKKPGVVLKRFENQLEPKISHLIHRYTLQGMRQEQGEPVDDFISRLKNLAAKCQFRDDAEVKDRVLDQLICGSRNPNVQKSLISRDKSLTLAATVETARSHEATSKHMKTLAGRSESHQEDRSINAIHKEQEREFCNNCGKQHLRNKCPAYGTSCRKCSKANHWQSVCRSSKRKQFNQGRQPAFKKVIHTIEDGGDEEDDEILTISTIEVNNIEDTRHSIHETRDEAFATLEIIQPEKKRKINLQCKVDTGAQSNVLPIRLLHIIAPETRYANIERELLAVVYGCEKFHSYLYGRSFVVKTDHRPLEQIHKKNLMQAPPRLQRMLLCLQPYDCIIKYLPGREMVTADALSHLSPLDEFEVSDRNVKVHHLIRITPAKMEEFKEETAKDETLQLLSRQVIQGWPDSGKKIVPALKPYWPLRDDISVEDGLILLGSRVIVPESLRGNILRQIHGGHFGIEKCKLRAKSCVYWPNIYKEIENLVNSCCICQKYHNSQQKEPMIPSEIPSRPWQTVSADLFYVQQSWFLIVVDYYSKFPFVKKLHNLTTGAVINEMKMLFAENGIPKSLQCDNGAQFTSGEFQQLASQYGFEIVTSSPHYPRGHGFIERQVQTVKKTIIKCRETKEDIDLALLALRTTPLSSNMPSPAELLNGQVFKSTLPGRIQPPKNQEEVRNWLKARQDNQCCYYNRHTKNSLDYTGIKPSIHKTP